MNTSFASEFESDNNIVIYEECSEINVQNVSNNSLQPCKKKLRLSCEACGCLTLSQAVFDKHLNSAKHIETISLKQNENGEYLCKKCEYSTKLKNNFQLHLKSQKHKRAEDKPKTYRCKICNESFTKYNPYWRHKNNCSMISKQSCEEIEDAGGKEELEDSLTDREVNLQILTYLKNDAAMKSSIIELLKGFQPGISLNNCNNTTTNTFNLQVFLKETCKDAVNLSEFIESINISLKDLDEIGNIGYVDGISQIIIRKLRELGETKRPIHCTDAKRQTLFVKQNNEWQKEGHDFANMQYLVDAVQHRNIRLLPLWQEQHPNCLTSSSKYTTFYNNMSQELLGGDCRKVKLKVKDNKIIKRIIKEVIIDKQSFAQIK